MHGSYLEDRQSVQSYPLRSFGGVGLAQPAGDFPSALLVGMLTLSQ